MATKYTASQIAEWFLAYNRLNVARNGGDNISNLKLQKLLYYAQGAYLGLMGELLYGEPLLAWTHGPVVESVYNEYEKYGNNGINFDDDYDSTTIDHETKNILTQVYDVFGQYSAWKLRNMTHEESPWIDTSQNEVISTGKIKEYFLGNVISDNK